MPPRYWSYSFDVYFEFIFLILGPLLVISALNLWLKLLLDGLLLLKIAGLDINTGELLYVNSFLANGLGLFFFMTGLMFLLE